MNDKIARTKQSAVALNRELKEFRCITQREWVGGVCSGVAYRLGIPTWIVRLVWFSSVALLGVGALAYIMLWVFVPEADNLPKDYNARTGD